MYLVILSLPRGKVLRLASSLREIEQKAIDVMMEHYSMTGTFRDILDQFHALCEKIKVEYFLLDIETGEGYPFDLDNINA